MKYKLVIILTLFFISTSLIGDEKKDNSSQCAEPDNMIPANTEFLLKVTRISNAVDFLNSKDSYNMGNLLRKNIKWIKALKDKTGIDVLNKKSLKDIGIDVDRALYLTSFGYDKNEPDSIFFLPITDKRNFPYYFIKFIKIISNNKNTADLNPAVTMYKDVRVFEIPGKIFFAVIDDNFVITSSGEALTSTIDMKTLGCVSGLSSDPFYKDYKNKSKTNSENSIFQVYLKNGFLNKTYNAVQGMNSSNVKTDFAEQKPDFNYINYISLSLDTEPGEFSFRTAVSVNKDDPSGDLLLKVLTTGLFKNALYADNPSGYHFISIDIKSINEYFAAIADKNGRAYKTYARIMSSDNNAAFLKEAVLPCSDSFINIIFKKPSVSGELDNFIFYIPMEECGDIEKTLKKIKNDLEKKYTEEDKFGEEKIDGHNSFWFTNESGSRIYILEHKGNIYAGNNPGFIKEVLNSSDKHYPDIKSEFVKRMDKNTFLLSYTQFDEESFFKALLMMLSYNINADLYGFVSKIGSMFLTGEKIDNELKFTLRLKMLNSNK